MKRDLREGYLVRYAEPDVSLAPGVIPREHVLVIPAFNESVESLTNVWKNIAEKFLVIVVVNATHEHKPTQQLLNALAASGELDATTIQSQPISYCEGNIDQPDLLIINRCYPPFLLPDRQGVGLARKIGADIALALQTRGEITSDLIHTTDADVVLPADYFTASDSKDGTLIYPFTHIASAAHRLSSALYDLSLLYYAQGLRQAGSAYGYTSIGSTLAFRGAAYAAVRGFPKREAGEDFYLLNKLAKVSSIGTVACAPIEITARDSDRVPFGTGPSLQKIGRLRDPEADYLFYHPEIFQLLGEMLTVFSRGAAAQEIDAIAPVIRELNSLWNMSGVFEKQRQQHNDAGFQKFLHDWFDGFRTLKFVHFLRERGFDSVPIHKTRIPGQTLPDKRQYLMDQLFPTSS